MGDQVQMWQIWGQYLLDIMSEPNSPAHDLVFNKWSFKIALQCGFKTQSVEYTFILATLGSYVFFFSCFSQQNSLITFAPLCVSLHRWNSSSSRRQERDGKHFMRQQFCHARVSILPSLAFQITAGGSLAHWCFHPFKFLIQTNSLAWTFTRRDSVRGLGDSRAQVRTAGKALTSTHCRMKPPTKRLEGLHQKQKMEIWTEKQGDSLAE